jgi:ABC-2 type transport system permease protein
MTWHKAWLETRWRFLTGLGVLALLAMGTVLSYPRLSKELLPLVTLPEGTGLVANAIRESIELSRTFRGYAWLNAFSQNFSQMGMLFAVLLGSGGLRTESAGVLYTLALPFSRRELMTTRAALGLAELFAVVMVPSLMIAALAPAIGEHFGVVNAVVHGLCLFAAVSVFFGFTFWLATQFSDVWRPGLIACGVAMAIGAVETVFGRALPCGLFQLAWAEGYFRNAQVPWLAMLVALGVAALLVHRAVVTVERQDF